MLAALWMALFGFAFQQLSVVPTLPAIQRDLDTSAAWATWVITAFLLVGAPVVPLIGRLADQFGSKPLLQGTLVLFTLASLAAAAAPHISLLIAARAVAGASAIFVALSVALSTQHLRQERVTRAIRSFMLLFASTHLVATIIAPPLADHLSWRWLFVVTAASGALALALSARGIPDVPVRDRAPVDVAGALLLALTIGLCMLALTEGNSWGWASAPIVAMFVGAGAAGVAWVVVQLRVPAPMVQLRLLTHRVVLLTNAATAFAGFGVFAFFVVVPRLLASGFDANSTETGLYVSVAMVSGLVGALSVERLTRRVGWKWPLAAGLGLLGVGNAILVFLHSEPWHVVLALSLLGYGTPIMTLTAAKLIGDIVRLEEQAVASALNMVAYYVGGVFGAQLCAAILGALTVAGSASDSAYTVAFAVCAAVTLAGVPLALMIGRRATIRARH